MQGFAPSELHTDSFGGVVHLTRTAGEGGHTEANVMPIAKVRFRQTKVDGTWLTLGMGFPCMMWITVKHMEPDGTVAQRTGNGDWADAYVMQQACKTYVDCDILQPVFLQSSCNYIEWTYP